MLKLYTRKLKKAWEDTATPITVNKREMILEFALCALTGVVVGMLVSPRKNQTFGSYNTGAVNNNTQPLAAADSDEDWWNMVYKWDDCPVLAGLDLGDYGPDTTQSRSGSSQEYLSRFYVGMRGAWNSGTADNLAGGEEFWQKLTEGAVSTAAPEG